MGEREKEVKPVSIFDSVVDRKNSDSVKWNGMQSIYGTNDLLPMWVADTDFKAPSKVIDALLKRVQHGVFGYATSPKQLYDAIIQWTRKRYHWEIKKEWIVLCSGVVKSIAFSIQALTHEGDKILIQTPIYPPFVRMIEKNNRVVIRNPLQLKNNKYAIDFDDFEKQLKSGVKLVLLCSPHNPTGRVWTKEELKQIADLCNQYDVPIVSDEIHGDIILPPHTQIPISSLDENTQNRTITLFAPSKTFNIPGLQCSIMVIPNAGFRKKIKEQMEKVAFHGPNLLSIVAAEAAYTYGEDWLEELNKYLQKNALMTKNFIEEEIPDLRVIPSEGTFLIWIDYRKLGLSEKEFMDRLIHQGKLALEPGTKYGPEGEGFVRMNIGCPTQTLKDGLNRLKHALT